MVYSVGVQSKGINAYNNVTFGKKENKKSECENHDRVLVSRNVFDSIGTSVKVQSNKLKNAFITYPTKGMKGSKNANFYEFLTMGNVPYLIGSGMMMAVFTLASKFFDTPAAKSSIKLGKKMSIGVVAYGLMKNLSKKFIQTPLKLVRGIDENMYYEKQVYELPEKGNKDKLVSKEYHKVFESVDFPRWDLLYNNEDFGEERNAYFNKVAKKFGYDETEVDYADQKVKSKIKESLIKSKVFSTLSSYLWAATAVGVSMQKPMEELILNPKTRLNNYKNYKNALESAKVAGKAFNKKYKFFPQDLAEKLIKSCKQFVNNNSKAMTIAGRGLLGVAVGMTVIGNLFTLIDFNKDKGSKVQASTSLIDDSKEKVVC